MTVRPPVNNRSVGLPQYCIVGGNPHLIPKICKQVPYLFLQDVFILSTSPGLNSQVRRYVTSALLLCRWARAYPVIASLHVQCDKIY